MAIRAGAADQQFRDLVTNPTRRLTAKIPPRKVPSASECRFCPISRVQPVQEAPFLEGQDTGNGGKGGGSLHRMGRRGTRWSYHSGRCNGEGAGNQEARHSCCTGKRHTGASAQDSTRKGGGSPTACRDSLPKSTCPPGDTGGANPLSQDATATKEASLVEEE